MKYIKLTSSNIHSASYSTKENKLFVKFVSRKKDEEYYEFSDVEPNTFIGLILDESAGTYFFKNIKEKYKFIKREG